MDEFGLPLVGTGIDFTKVSPVDKKKLLVYVNHFVSQTVTFLNKFSSVCETKMMDIESKLDSLEVLITILESKLSSIPSLKDIKVAKSSDATDAASSPAASAPPESIAAATSTSSEVTPAAQELQPEPEEASNVIKVSQDARYIKFFKMVNFGVPASGVKLKMAAEGLDPDLLDNPDAPAPDGGEIDEPEDDSDSDDASDDFSD